MMANMLQDWVSELLKSGIKLTDVSPTLKTQTQVS